MTGTGPGWSERSLIGESSVFSKDSLSSKSCALALYLNRAIARSRLRNCNGNESEEI